MDDMDCMDDMDGVSQDLRTRPLLDRRRTLAMIVDYLNAALERATYEIIDDQEPYYGEVPGIDGVWATGKTLEACRRNLAQAVEDWILFSVHRKGLSKARSGAR